MSYEKKAPKRSTWKVFDPKSKAPFELSRSKIDLFMQCPRCFYLDRRCGVGRPKSFPFNLNNAVDALLKKEFDSFRAISGKHPLMKEYGIEAVPYDHDSLDEWRDALKRGISYVFEPANLFIRGGIDDVWMNDKGELHIVDYKATSKDSEINLDAEWQDGYKRQVEIYQWLFRQNNFKVSDIAYFVYVNGKTDREAFDAKLEFDVSILPYKGDTKWIPTTLMTIRKCLDDDRIPAADPLCEHCGYVRLVQEVVKEKIGKNSNETKSDVKSVADKVVERAVKAPSKKTKKVLHPSENKINGQLF